MAVMQHQYVLMDYDSGENPAETYQADRVQLIPLEQDGGPCRAFIVVFGEVGEGGANFAINARGVLPEGASLTSPSLAGINAAGPVYVPIDADGDLYPDQSWAIEASGDTVPTLKLKAVLYTNWQFKVLRTPVS